MVSTRGRRVRRGRPARLGARATIAALAALIAVAGSALPSGAASSWSIVASPIPPGGANGGLAALACPTPTLCLAIGTKPNFGFEAHRWNGSAWSLVPIDSPVSVTGSGIVDIACPSGSRCFAVGSLGSPTRTPVIERWNGVRWTSFTAPKPQGTNDAGLTSVACPTASFCMATGLYHNKNGDHSYSARWNGGAWSVAPVPQPPNTYLMRLDSVSCVTPTDCYAGGVLSASTDITLVEHWNGTSWSRLKTPTPAGHQQLALNDVSCPTAKFCFAVGWYNQNGYHHPFAMRRDGSTWTLLATSVPSGSDENFFGDVSCVSATFCFTAGYTATPAGTSRPWLKRWNGKTWATVASPAAGNASGLSAVTCRSASVCMAVGTAGVVGDQFLGINQVTFSMRWNGSAWKLGPTPTGGSQSQLQQIACVGASFCVAVGTAANPATKALTMRWDGSSWSITPTPNPAGAIASSLRAVACASTTSCLAIGTVFNGSAITTLVERWNGTKWSVAASPSSSGVGSSSLTGIACATSTNCFAVGVAQHASQLIERWNGTQWNVAVSGNQTALSAVSCATSTSCVAVGGSGGSMVSRHWNGTSWSTVTTPIGASVTGVSCSAADACTAVGSSNSQPLLERWNGTAWSNQTSPAVGTNYALLNGVACFSTARCAAVGLSDGHLLVEEWDGSSWTIGTGAHRTGADFDPLYGVACPTATTCIGVGYAHTNLFSYALIERTG